MILLDISSVFHRMIHASSNSKLAKKWENKFITDSFINLTKRMIIEELISIENNFSGYGDLVICMDDASKQYWRRDYFPKYKHKRKAAREESEIDWSSVYEHLDELMKNITEHLPWKVVRVPGAEADDIILVLAREYGSRGEKILIHSPDKDLIQAQLDNPNVKQYSALTKKWIVPENKHDDMSHWLLEHVCLGDESDGVPKVVDDTEFSENFKGYLISLGIKELNPWDFKNSSLSPEEKKKIISSYNIYKHNRKGEIIGLDIYEDARFGASNLQKIVSGEYFNNLIIEDLEAKKKEARLSGKKELYKSYLSQIKNYESIIKTPEEFLNIWLDSHPLYRPNYERNSILVLESGIPNHIKQDCIAYYVEATNKFNRKQFEEFLINHNIMELSLRLSHFEKAEELSAQNCGW